MSRVHPELYLDLVGARVFAALQVDRPLPVLQVEAWRSNTRYELSVLAAEGAIHTPLRQSRCKDRTAAAGTGEVHSW